MKLYRISQSVNDDWDTYDSVIVMANSEFEAQRIHPSGNWKYGSHSWASDPKDVSVELIGEADPSLGNRPQVILASYNAG